MKVLSLKICFLFSFGDKEKFLKFFKVGRYNDVSGIFFVDNISSMYFKVTIELELIKVKSRFWVVESIISSSDIKHEKPGLYSSVILPSKNLNNFNSTYQFF